MATDRRKSVTRKSLRRALAAWYDHDISGHHLQAHMMATVSGMDITKKSHQPPLIESPMSPSALSKKAMPKKLDTADAGRKIMVSAAIDFMEALSFFVSMAITVLSSVSFWAMR